MFFLKTTSLLQKKIAFNSLKDMRVENDRDELGNIAA